MTRCEPNVLDISINTDGDISAFEIVAEITSTDGGAFFTNVNVVWDTDLGVLTHRIIDLDGVDYTSPDTIRIAGMLIEPEDQCLAAGPTTVAQLEFTTNDVCSGTIDFAGATFTCPENPDVVASTQFVDCATTALVPATVTGGTVTVVNAKPSIAAIPDTTIHWGDPLSIQTHATDPDTIGGCENLSYSLLPGAPDGMTVNGAGQINWVTDGQDVCEHTVSVVVSDGCSAKDTTSFTICVENTPPTITCPPDTIHVIWGEQASGSVTGNDPDGGPSPLLYSVASFDGLGTPMIDGASGAWTWQTVEGNNDYLGYHHLCLAVSDGANTCVDCSPSNADTCCVVIHVIPTLMVSIEKTHGTLQGLMEEVSVDLNDYPDPPNEMGGFDFLIQYDASALTFSSAAPGELLTDCGWEYFTYRYGPNGNCGPNACPSGVLRVVALAETNNGANHPGCFTYGGTVTSSELVKLSFLVSNDLTLECQYVPIRFIWYDCGDNSISSKSGDTLFISRHVYDFDVVDPIEHDEAFPTLFGAPTVCNTSDKYEPLRLVDFQNGGIDIVCADSIDARGDLNLNGQAYEIADAVLYTNYFVYGIGVFKHEAAQTAASDVNADGIPLSIGDLVYLVRVIVGDAQPYPKVVTPTEVQFVNNDGTLRVGNDVLMGAALVVAKGNVTPTLEATNMEMLYHSNGDETRILVYSLKGEGFTGSFLTVPGEIVSMEMATYQGYPVSLDQLPTNFALHQNYPNPFNPSTTISFDLPSASDYTLTVYNVQGQVVERWTGSAQAGTQTITWEAANSAASGIYFYRLEAGEYTATKKMVLVK